jgi:hypothetical protein
VVANAIAVLQAFVAAAPVSAGIRARASIMLSHR